MNRLSCFFHRCPGLILAVLFAAPAFGQTGGAPNFILILADDLGWSSLSQAIDDRVPNSRSDFHETPALERLARSGMRFSHGYAPASICTPTRRSIQLGNTPTRQGDERFAREFRRDPNAHPAFPYFLKAAHPRYRTAHFGKWDLRADIVPEEFGYDESDGDTGNRNGDVGGDKENKFTAHHLNNDPKRTDTLTRRTLSFIRRNHAAGTPFFVQLSHYATHVDIQCRPETYQKYAQKKPGRIHAHAGWAAMLEDLDTSVGRILDAVEALHLSQSTYVIFLADNGGVEFLPQVKNKMAHPSEFASPARNHPLRGGKWVLYEGGIRVPFIVAGPGIKAGSQCDVPVAGWDLLPTVADLAGYRAPLPPLDGGSLRPLFANGQGRVQRPEEGFVFHRYTTAYPHSAIRLGDFKLVKIWKSNALELYNLADDLGETVNLAEKNPAKTAELHDRLMNFMRGVDAEVLHSFATKPR